MDELEVLRIRDEVLQAMYWMRSEGIADTPTLEELSRFLAVPEPTLAAYLGRFVEDDLLVQVDTMYRLSPAGEESGKRTFADEMADLTKPPHGECDADCWCHESPDAAADCLAHKAGHVHSN
ncbi:MAG: hypothetical protein H0T43_03695 [Solirubrobacterales bacterium]|nr:hypothetical protein [Solirubrobacterales bacterium]